MKDSLRVIKTEHKPNASKHRIHRSYGVMYYVSNRAVSKKFYKDLLGQSPSYDSNEWIEFDLGDQNLCLQPTDQKIPKKNLTRIILEVLDLNAIREYLEKKKIKIEDDIQSIKKAPGRFMNIQDPDGNTIGLYSPKNE